MHRAAIATCLLVVLAGCSGLGALPDGEPETRGPGDGGVVTGTPPSESPWGERVLTVSLTVETDSDRNLTRELLAAVAYWNGTGREYAPYPIAFRYVDGGTPDVRVVVVEEVERCGAGHGNDSVGCAPIVRHGGSALDRPVTVRIEDGWSNETTRAVMKHELGHLAGLDHDDEPADVMRPVQRDATLLPRPDARNRSWPWNGTELAVAVVADGGLDGTERAQVDAALGYVSGGADGHLARSPTLTRVDDPASADLVLRVTDDGTACRPTFAPSSCLNVSSGVQADGDPAAEYWDRAEVTAAGVDAETLAWHLAFNLVTVMGLDADAERPPALRSNASAETRRGEWWS